MPVVSRNPMVFLQRNGLRPTMRLLHPQLDLRNLRVNLIPLQHDQLDPFWQLTDVSGAPPQDRGRTDTWPPPQEVV